MRASMKKRPAGVPSTATTTALCTVISSSSSSSSCSSDSSRDWSSSNKRSKNTPATIEDISAIRLPDDVFSVVFEFLSPRELHTLTLTNRTIASSLTRSTVIRASTLQGGHAATTMASMLELMERRSIHVPSPMRLLRMAVGKKCELASCVRRVHTARPQFGVFMCAECVKKHTTSRAVWKVGGQEQISTTVAFESGTSTTDSSSSSTTKFWTTPYKFWTAPYKTAGGELCGPIVTITQVDQMLLSNQTKTIQDLEQFAQTVAASSYETTKGQLGELRKVYDAALIEVTKATLDKTARKQQAIHAKELKLQAYVARVAEMVHDDWRQDCMTARWPTCSCCTGPVFESPVVSSLFKVVKDAPSKGTKKRLRMIADAINTNFQIIRNSGIRELTFLSQDEDKFPFQAHLRAYLWDHIHEDRALKMSLTDVQYLDDDEAFLVLKRVLWSTDGCSLCVATPTMMHVLVANGPPPGRHVRQCNVLAREAWRRCGATTADTSEQLLKLYELNYARARKEYNQLSAAVLEFVNHPTTSAYLQGEQNDNKNNVLFKSTMLRVVNGIWINKACRSLIQNGGAYDDLLHFCTMEANKQYATQNGSSNLELGLPPNWLRSGGSEEDLGQEVDLDEEMVW